MDALLIIFADGKSVLVPWDVNLADQFSSVTEIRPYTGYNRNFVLAVKSLAEEKFKSEQGQKLYTTLLKNNQESSIEAKHSILMKNDEKSGDAETVKPVIELSSSASYLLVTDMIKNLSRFSVFCRSDGSDSYIESKRIIKSETEIKLLKKAASITDKVFMRLEKYLIKSVESGKSELTETDIALFIETEGRKLGAEGTGFETLAASPERSFSIHPFPSYSDKTAPAEGLTIIDFGHKYSGYTSDVTTTAACGRLTERQEKMISLVEEAVSAFEAILAPGLSTVVLTESVTSIFEKNGFTMPHALGHGIGLDVHESPVLKSIKETETFLKPGMVLAIEPGIYCPESGGVRLENDYLITETGFEKLTNSKIIRME